MKIDKFNIADERSTGRLNEPVRKTYQLAR